MKEKQYCVAPNLEAEEGKNLDIILRTKLKTNKKKKKKKGRNG